MGKKFYFSERTYSEKNQKINLKAVEYWSKILGKETIELIKEAYGMSLEDILFRKYDVKEYLDTAILEKLITKFWDDKCEENATVSKTNNIVFYEFAQHFIKFGEKVFFEKTIGNQNIPALDECFHKNLSEKIVRLSVSTLMFEMYLLKENGELHGNNAKEEYEDYCKRYLSDRKYVKELFEIYPCLERMLMEVIENATNNYSLLLMRLIADNNMLAEKFNSGKEMGQVVKVESSGSDSHKKGKSVFIIGWSTGKKIVYKPHSLETEVAFQKLQEYLTFHCKLKSKEFLILNRGTYGWEEFIEYQSCKSENEIKRYYYRVGMLIFCTYLLNVNDIHTENLIAAGEYPVIIDSETVMGNKRGKDKKRAIEKVYDQINESVLNSGILPLYKYAQNGKGIDMSAINGKEGDVYPILVPILQEVGLSTMHYEYQYPIRKKGGNCVSLNGNIMKPGWYVNFIIEGFEDAYKEALENKGKLLRYINIFRNLKVRHLVQDTQRYSMLLHTSYNPDFLQDGSSRQLFLCTILKNAKEVQGNLEVAKLEIKDMLNMDVPYFYSNTSDTNLYGSEGECIKGYFAEPSFQHLCNKVKALSQADLERQTRYIKIILTDLNDLKVEKIKKDISFVSKNKDSEDEYSIKINAVLKLFNILQRDAIYGDDNEDVNWMGVKPIGEKGNSYWQIRPLGMYLYDGIGGIGIFYHALNHYLCDEKLHKNCEAFDNTLFQYTNDMLERTEGLESESSGAFAGEASIVYIYEVLYSITKKMKYLEYAKNHAKILKKSVSHDLNNDIIYGNAGAIIVLLNLYHLTQDISYLEWANIAGKRLVKNQKEGGWYNRDEEMLTGFSHGISGIVFALAILNSENDKQEYRSAIDCGIFCEDTMYVENYNNWLDNRKEAQKQESKFMAAWCHGAPGILLARSKIYNLMPEESAAKPLVLQDINKALVATEKYGFSDNDCLCHGNLGNSEILLEYTRELKKGNMEQKYREVRTIIAQGILNDTYDCARHYLYGYKIPGFMTGVSGMAYSLLRDICPDLPCILSLEI